MNDFNFKSQIATSREQSKRLLALGLKPETADMSSDGWNDPVVSWGMEWSKEVIESGRLPAWSLHRLIEMMPKCVRARSIGDDSPRLHPHVPRFDYQGVIIENIDEILTDFYQHTDLFDNLIDCIEWLIKEGYFPKEYLV